MFKKLSPALVAISLVAVAQPALAGSGWVPQRKCMTIESKTDNSVTGGGGSTWTYSPVAKVIVEGKEADKTQVQVGMFCIILGKLKGISDFINCTKEIPSPPPC